jgi:hypothetical protein
MTAATATAHHQPLVPLPPEPVAAVAFDPEVGGADRDVVARGGAVGDGTGVAGAEVDGGRLVPGAVVPGATLVLGPTVVPGASVVAVATVVAVAALVTGVVVAGAATADAGEAHTTTVEIRTTTIHGQPFESVTL